MEIKSNWSLFGENRIVNAIMVGCFIVLTAIFTAIACETNLLPMIVP